MKRTPELALRMMGWLWASPATVVGLVIAGIGLATRGRVARVAGAIEVLGGWPKVALERWVPLRGGAEALTLGHVVVGRTAEGLCRLRGHERVHVRQWERWGLFFPPAYACASLWAWAKGGDPYRDNVFEREARASSR